ncbi:hypothetical protein Mapa_001684 [Marchantia paleacea]|nr:hypothetical protein Mapa_001684 [Marchantia paleacea]
MNSNNVLTIIQNRNNQNHERRKVELPNESQKQETELRKRRFSKKPLNVYRENVYDPKKILTQDHAH